MFQNPKNMFEFIKIKTVEKCGLVGVMVPTKPGCIGLVLSNRN